MEMELVHGGAKVLGCAWLWFCFPCVWMISVLRDRRK
jgi:cbb3-type cytochrome oxidase subunit 3